MLSFKEANIGKLHLASGSVQTWARLKLCELLAKPEPMCSAHLTVQLQRPGLTLNSLEHTCKVQLPGINNILHQGMWCWDFMFIDTCRLTSVSASTAQLGRGCLTLLPGWEEKWTPYSSCSCSHLQTVCSSHATGTTPLLPWVKNWLLAFCSLNGFPYIDFLT